jgi:hypothetical protein
MRSLMLSAFAAALLGTTSLVHAQVNPPGAEQQDRGIRDDAGRPSTRTVPSGEGTVRVAPSVGQGQPGPRGEREPPGGRYQDEKNNEEIGKPPTGEK